MDKNVNQPKVSIIVPIYNAGLYLIECMETLVKQTLSEIEIICVLDSPTDGSDKIIEKYAEKDDRVKVIKNKKNLHIAESRNKGIMIATGEYIGFSDHDDYRSLNMYLELFESTKEIKPDIVFSNSRKIYETYNESVIYNNPSKEGIIQSIILPINHSLNKNKLSRSVWASIYRKQFILDNKISFPDRRELIEEDTFFNLKSFLASNNIVFINSIFYNWRIYNDSTSNEIKYMPMLNYFNFLVNILEEYNVLRKYRLDVNRMISFDFYSNFHFYEKMKTDDIVIFFKLLKKTRFPLFGNYELSFLSRKRLKLTIILIKLYIKSTINHTLYA